VAALVDTNILVYRYDRRDPEKQKAANEILRRGLDSGELRIPHQALVEFVSVVTRPSRPDGFILGEDAARDEVERLLVEFVVLYPDELVLRTALRGMAAYRLSWFDAHMWAYAETNGLEQILSEDFQHGRLYGSVLAVNPFLRA
jgi:predicted nucleic acid-binding protein